MISYDRCSVTHSERAPTSDLRTHNRRTKVQKGLILPLSQSALHEYLRLFWKEPCKIPKVSLFSSEARVSVLSQAGLPLSTELFSQFGFRRLFKRRGRGPRHRAVADMRNGSLQFSVATYNLRGVMDRWSERQPLLRDCLEEMDADVMCFQECLTGEHGQDRDLLDPSYHIFPCKAALFHLLSSGNALLRAYAQTVASMLKVKPLRQLMISAPERIESIRERFRLDASPYRILRDLSLAPFFGNSVACRLADAHEIKHSTLLLGNWRAAQRIEFYIGNKKSRSDAEYFVDESAAGLSTKEGEGGGLENNSGIKVWIVNTHLDHEHPDIRQQQAVKVVKWMESVRYDAAVVVLCGDFNGSPNEPFHAVFRDLGYKSGYALKHGKEPEGTWPTGIEAPLMDHGEFECLDYVYVWAADGYAVDVVDASIHGNQPHPKNSTLYPSDHAAVKLTLAVKQTQLLDGGSGSSEKH